MTDYSIQFEQDEKIGFTVESVERAFFGQSRIADLLLEEGTEPEELTEYLNEAFSEEEMEMLASMYTDHRIPIEGGGIVKIREVHDYDTWKNP